MYSFVDDLPEEGLSETKQVGGASEENKQLLMFMCEISWIKYRIHS